MKRTLLSIKAVQQIGLKPSFLLLCYRLGLYSGFFDIPIIWGNSSRGIDKNAFQLSPIISLPEKEKLNNCLNQQDIVQICDEADEILNGKVRLFGGEAVDLILEPSSPLHNWTAYETRKATIKGDVKSIWEPARFGWAYTLARAFYLTGDEKYSLAFWQLTKVFLKANPPYKGPQWISAQEAAFRLISLVFAWHVFSSLKSADISQSITLGKAIAVHANRIPPTMIYARAQNNNHLISEAAGLITAALALPRHPNAERWIKIGEYWFNRGLEEQIDHQGCFIQQSTNYHRLMLQLALWINLLIKYQDSAKISEIAPVRKICLTEASQQKLQAATYWLMSLVDQISGRCPNLGPNDGAYFQPLCVNPFTDYRPILQASSMVFLRKPAFNKGNWDEMSLWYGADTDFPEEKKNNLRLNNASQPWSAATQVIKNPISQSWVYLRIAAFKNRPGHADQLHVDLWRQGENITLDAGSYKYNDAFPWNNALSKTAIHNTITINGLDQMTPAGKFLWLDWAQTKIVDAEKSNDNDFSRISAEHDGYRKIGILHRRSVSAEKDGSWLINDQLLPTQTLKKLEKKYSIRIHWLLCDAPWRLENGNLFLSTQKGKVMLKISCEIQECNYQLVRAGELLAGEGDFSPTWGWVSPHYSYKIPAISFSATYIAKPPVLISTKIEFQND